jgi:hypothetical protein
MSSVSLHELLAEIDKHVTETLGNWSYTALYKNVVITVVRPPSRIYEKVDLNSPQARIWVKLNTATSERGYEKILRTNNLSMIIECTQYRHLIKRPGNYIDMIFENGLPVLKPEKLIEAKSKRAAYSRIKNLLEERKGKEPYALKYRLQPGIHSLLEYMPKAKFRQLKLEEAFRLKNRELPSWGPKPRVEGRLILRPDIVYIFPETGCNMEVEVKTSSQIWSPVEDLRRQLEMYYFSNILRGFERNSQGVVEPVVPTRREQSMFTELHETIRDDMTFLPQCVSTPERIARSARSRLRYLKRKKEEVVRALEEAKEKRLKDSINEFSQQLKIIEDEEEESENILRFVPKLFED